MQNSQVRKAKALRPADIFPHWYAVQESEKIADNQAVARARRLSEDPVKFSRQVVGFKPTKYQVQLIRLFKSQDFVALRWCRQSGKSWIVSALLLWYALTHEDSYLAVLGPSWRQAKLIIRRITYFLKNIPPTMYFKPQRTKLTFTNGSIIEAFPNNPDTIRGPTLHVVYIDEFNFVANDEELYDAVLFTLSTTNGRFLCSSTPWNTDSIFYKIFNHKDFSDFATSHVAWEQALEPDGPLRKKILDKIRRQFAEDPWRWKREMEAEWAEDETVWLPQSLITKCIASQKTLGHEIELYGWQTYQQGTFFAGLDLGKHQDYSALIVIEEVGNKFLLRHFKLWPFETSYASVIGYVKALQDRWGGFSKIRVDMTGVGDYIVEDMKNAEIDNVEGVNFSVPRKQEMASLLKQRMVNHQFWFPYFTWERPYRGEYVTELNVERFEVRKDGSLAFSHPKGTHDDVFWATALAVYATMEMTPEPYVTVIPK